MVPDSWSFQHFIDGVLPKMVQAWEQIQPPFVGSQLESNSHVVLMEVREQNRVRDTLQADHLHATSCLCQRMKREKEEAIYLIEEFS